MRARRSFYRGVSPAEGVILPERRFADVRARSDKTHPSPCHPEEHNATKDLCKEQRPCHFDLVVARLCCQHFAERQNARLARRLLLFPKISLRCDFREPCLLTEWRNLARKRIGRQTPLPCSERLCVLYKIPPLGRTTSSIGMTTMPRLPPFLRLMHENRRVRRLVLHFKKSVLY